jgi:hypothetical protein
VKQLTRLQDRAAADSLTEPVKVLWRQPLSFNRRWNREDLGKPSYDPIAGCKGDLSLNPEVLFTGEHHHRTRIHYCD